VEGEARDRSYSLTKEAIVVANQTELDSLEVVDLDLLSGGTACDNRGEIVNGHRSHGTAVEGI